MSISHSNRIHNLQAGQNVPPGRIVNGYDVDPPHKYSTFVSIQSNGSHKCGGTLLNGNTILTAAHCIKGRIESQIVKINRHDLSKTDAQEGGETYSVTERIVHPKYNPSLIGMGGYDIAIFKINNTKGEPTKVEFDTDKYYNDDDKLLTAIGWGDTKKLPQTTILQEVKVPVYNFEKCQQDYKETKYIIENWDTQFCAGYPEGQRDSCNKDSGGPLFFMKNGAQVLVGLTSYGDGCALPNRPGVYTRIAPLIDWVKDNI
ncbi:putative trypsin-like serine protease precursor [Conidiobolus coronatus NRRL 28638]|uniref:Putative trypsin-like serine protease n=1 Tax=Conidiobolus coronatus (strain ATCC 28846 / CBS 209.66 / NRRL 28638) TaxID=796925 RepID=A0A137NRQ0_CONC2|nr:putative trypsin-like serine protease precursor [Conidiobolus coronatus NRRL 28638]|eukprot:KXN65421.1 putative trypsin-like serine protease precursor [Conidiobolus coronatus NRRL 28638]